MDINIALIGAVAAVITAIIAYLQLRRTPKKNNKTEKENAKVPTFVKKRIKIDSNNLQNFLKGNWSLSYNHPDEQRYGDEDIKFVVRKNKSIDYFVYRHYYNKSNSSGIPRVEDIRYDTSYRRYKLSNVKIKKKLFFMKVIIEWDKINLDIKEKRSCERLIIVDNSTMEGADDLGFILKYTRINPYTVRDDKTPKRSKQQTTLITG